MQKREQYRQIGAISGLLLGWGAMWAFWTTGLVPAAVTGISGCILGAIIGERVWDSKHAKDETKRD